MTTYSCFEDLPVWQAAIELKFDIDDLYTHRLVRRRRAWIDQIDRASLSISNNIAEGFERGTTNELLMFLYIARGSAGETRSLLRYLEGRMDRLASTAKPKWQSSISDLKSQISDLIPRCESVSRQIRAWADSLQNSDIRGQRHLNEQSRGAYDQAKRRDEFWQRIRREHEARFESSRSDDAARSVDTSQ